MKRLPSPLFIFKRIKIKQITIIASGIFFQADNFKKISLLRSKEVKFIIFTLTALTTIFFAGCRKGGRCEEAPNIYVSSIVIDFKDEVSGKYLYTEYFPLYNKDSLRVFNPKGQSLVILSSLNQIPNTSDSYWVLDFGSLYDDQTDIDSYSAEICKNYIIKYAYNEIDTVKVCFKSRKTSCGSVFETLKVYNKGQLIGTTTDNTSAEVTIFKD